MLKYKTISIIFICIIAGIAAADFFLEVPLLIYAGTILAYTSLLAWGSASISSGFYIQTLCRGKMGSNSITLTFDDGPDSTFTPAILDILERENIRASFFVTGCKALENGDLIKRIDKEGHLIGAHSFSHHYFFDFFRRSTMLSEMEKTEEIIEKLITRKIKMFRPPYGVTNPRLAHALRLKKYHVIGWSLRSGDSVITKEEELLKRITERLGPGDIVLFHDTRSVTVNILEKFITFARAAGLRFERLDKHLEIEAYGKN